MIARKNFKRSVSLEKALDNLICLTLLMTKFKIRLGLASAEIIHGVAIINIKNLIAV
jgi:hypothetical protein